MDTIITAYFREVDKMCCQQRRILSHGLNLCNKYFSVGQTFIETLACFIG